MSGEAPLGQGRMVAGVWEAVLPRREGEGAAPRLVATHEGRDVPGVTVEASGGTWVVRVPVPHEAVADGVQTVVVAEAEGGAVLGSFALVAGAALAPDLRAEIDLLRAELDMLKRAFRRHCLETAGPGS